MANPIEFLFRFLQISKYSVITKLTLQNVCSNLFSPLLFDHQLTIFCQGEICTRFPVTI